MAVQKAPGFCKRQLKGVVWQATHILKEVSGTSPRCRIALSDMMALSRVNGAAHAAPCHEEWRGTMLQEQARKAFRQAVDRFAYRCVGARFTGRGSKAHRRRR